MTGTLLNWKSQLPINTESFGTVDTDILTLSNDGLQIYDQDSIKRLFL